jgi:precorrin-2/cobalt-factor-2 C20-methyltransferase
VTGTLYGIGVGPGDPELMTLKAHRLIASAPVIAWPAPATGPSLARSIAAAAIASGTEEVPIRIPMGCSPATSGAIYDTAADTIASHLAAGRDVAALCEGDPFFFGTFTYLHARLAPRFPTVVVPGVASPMAAAASARRPLCARDGTFTVLPATLPDEALRARLADGGASAIMKLGRHLPRLRALLTTLDRAESALYVARASQPGEQIPPQAEAPDPAPYFSMLQLPGPDA